MRYRRFPALDTDISVLGFEARWASPDGSDLCLMPSASDPARRARAGRQLRRHGSGLRRVGAAGGPGAAGVDRSDAGRGNQGRGTRTRAAVRHPDPGRRGVSRGHVTSCTETSLRELGVDTIDLQQLHIYWPTWGLEGYWMDELHALKQAGKVRSVGVSVPDHRADMVVALVQSGLVDSVQTIVNIFDSQPLDVLVPICEQHGVAVIARCILDEVD